MTTSRGPAIAQLLTAARVIPVLTIERVEDAVPLARALVAGGVRTLEITLRTDAAVAAAKAPAELGDSMQRLVRFVDQGRCPGDEFSDQVIEHGLAPTVARLAQGEP